MVALTAVLTCAGPSTLLGARPAAAQDWSRQMEAHVRARAAAQAHAAFALQDEVQTRAARQREAAARAREQQRRAIQGRGRQLPGPLQNVRNWPEATEPFSRTVPLGSNGTFDLQNVAGDIVITGGRGGDARIEAVKRVRHPNEAQARAMLQQLRIEIVQRGGNIDVRTFQPRGPSTFAQVDYTVSVPSGVNVAVRTAGGNVRVTNLNGELRAESANGDVTATGVRRMRLVRTMSGNIELADGEADELTASTMSGSLIVRNVKGRFFDLQSVTGLVRLADVAPDRVNLRSTNGDIEYLGRFARSGRYEFQSHLGNIRVTPTSNQGFDIQASTFGGTFSSDYALKILQDTASGRRGGSRVVRGTFGDAGAAITAHSFNGDIVLVRR
jgi:DUF4097 and DUF4098 domain-containing protein YvlB